MTTKKREDHEQEKQSTAKFLSQLSNSARSAPEYYGITSLELLSKYNEKKNLTCMG